MQKTRFEGRVRLIRAAKWAIGQKIGRAAFIFAVLLPLGGVLTACIPAKEPVVEMKNETGLRVRAPEGAIIPAGLDRIELNMTHAEVMRILSSLYDVRHSADATEESPVVDLFYL